MTTNVLALIVTYNRKELLKKVLEALLQQQYQLHKIIVIDNNSSDGTFDFLAETKLLNNDLVIYKNTGANLGGAGGFNFGFKEAENYNYDYLWLMDDDFLPTPECLKELLQGEMKGIIQPIRYNMDETCAELSALTYDLKNPLKLNPKGLSVKKYLQLNSEHKEILDIAVMPFEGPLISKCAVEKIGYPEGKYFIFGDDIDYAVRATRLNIPIVCNLKAKAYRLLVNHQANDLLSWKGYFMLRNLFHIHKKYGHNLGVRNKPWVLAFGYTAACVSKGQFAQLKVIFNAMRDSKNLSNTEVFRPGSKK